MQHTKQVLDGDKQSIFKRKREFYLDEDLVDKIDSIEYGAQVNTIEEIQVNGVPVEPDESKTVHLNIPRVIDALTSDSSTDALSARMGKYLYSLHQNPGVLYRYRGSVATFDDLPESGNQQGDVYNILDTGMNYAWTGTEWDALGGSIYTAGYGIEISDTNVISAVRHPDHYLGHWNCIEGQSPDFLETAPYDYNAGDYYIVNKTVDMSWTKRVEMLGGEYHIPSLEEIEKMESNEKAAEVIYNITNYHAGGSTFNIIIPSNPDDINLDVFLWASNGCYNVRTSDSDPYYGFDTETASAMPLMTNGLLQQVLAFKDEPAIPDNTWTSLGDDVYYNASLGLYSVQVGEDEWITFKDKLEGATTSGGKGNLYQRGNCNPIDVNEYEINTDEIDYSQIQPSTYSSYKITADEDLFANADDAWGYVTDTEIAMRGPCPEGYIVTDSPEMYIMGTLYINGFTGSMMDIASSSIFDLSMQFLVNQEYDRGQIVGSVAQEKYTPIDPTGLEGRVKIHEENDGSVGQVIYRNEAQGLISFGATSNGVAQYRRTFKDKLLGATEIFDPVGEYLERGYIILNKAKLGNQYNWGNNYTFDLFGNESIKFNIGSDTDVVTELQSKDPYGYNGSIVLSVNMGGGGGGDSEVHMSIKSSSESISLASIYSANPKLWNYVKIQHNLRPLGTEYVEDPSTDSEIEDERVDINDIYLYDGTQWLLIGNHIVPHVFVTQKEYNAISDKKYSNGTLYLFVDAHPGEENCDGMYEYDYFYNLWTEWDGGRKASSINPSDFTYCKDYIVAELNSKPMCYYNKFREENKLVAGHIPDPSPKSGNTKIISNIDVRFLGTEEDSGGVVITRGAYLDYVETNDDACGCDECTYRFYTIDGSQWFDYNSYCGGGSQISV